MEKNGEWLLNIAEEFLEKLREEPLIEWSDFKNQLAGEGIWGYLGAYESSPEARFLKDRHLKCSLYDGWNFLNWLKTVYYFNGGAEEVTAATACAKIAAFLPTKALAAYWEKNSKNRTPLLKNPALLSSLELAKLSAFIEFLENPDRRQNQIRRQSFTLLLLDGAIQLAWADKKLLFDEKEGLRYQIMAAELDGESTDYLLKILNDTASDTASFEEYLKAVRNSRLSFLEKRILLIEATVSSLLDGEQGEEEKKYLLRLGEALQINDNFIAEIAIEITKLLADHPTVKMSEANWIFERLQRKITADLVETLQKSAARIWQEVQETGDLCLLLGRAAKGMPLSDFEMERVKAQLIDIAKVVPALAIFMLPGGMVFLGVLLKVLPFNIMPSAFVKKEGHHAI